jgi:hypothetical protein
MAERQRARQAAGDEVVRAALEAAERRDLKGRLLALAAEAGR